MKNLIVRWLGLLISFLCVSGFGQSGPPALPPDPLLQIFNFPTNFVAPFGAVPLAYTNIFSVPVWRGNALVLEMTNAEPAFLHYNLVETNGNTNLSFTTGTIILFVAPDWASADTNQYGNGPGQRAYFVAAGDWRTGSPNGFFGLSTDPYGTNLSFWGMSNGVTTTYVNTAISWSSNAWHALEVEYSPSNSFLFVDGQLAASGIGVTVVPGTNTWSNGLWIGSDSAGFEQARGAFWHMETWDIQWDGALTSGWTNLLSQITAWQGVQGGGGFGTMGMGMGSGSLTGGGGSTNCVTGTNVYLANMSAMPDANGDGGMTFQFSIEGGTNGVAYDVFATTNLWFGNITSGVWNWLGQGTNGGAYAITNQSTNQQFYILGGTPAQDGSGLTIAYENLISHGSWSDVHGTPLAWYIWQGLNPQTPGIATQDPGQDGLANWQKYLYGANPLVSEGFAVWVGQPNGTSGIP